MRTNLSLLIFNVNYPKAGFCPIRDKIFIEKVIPCLTSPVRDGILMDKFKIEYDSRYLLKDIQ